MTEDEFVTGARWYIFFTKVLFVGLGLYAVWLFLFGYVILAVLSSAGFFWSFSIHHRIVGAIRSDYALFREHNQYRSRFRGKNDDL